MDTTAVTKKCKECGVELPSIWYYYSRHIKYDPDRDIHMDVLDGPFCQRCLILVSTRHSEEEKNDELSEWIESGLITDGAHHKQWYLEKTLSLIMGEEYVKTMRDENGEWEKGIPP